MLARSALFFELSGTAGETQIREIRRPAHLRVPELLSRRKSVMEGRADMRVVVQPCQESKDVRNDASNAGSRSPLRPPDPILESKDGRIYFRPSQQDPHRQPRKDDGALPGSDEIHPPTGLEQ